MAKKIILSVDSEPKSPKYLLWELDENECEVIREAIGADLDDQYPLLMTLSSYYEDFMCTGERLLGLSNETIDLIINLEEHHRESVALVKLLTMLGGLGALAHDQGLGVYGYSE